MTMNPTIDTDLVGETVEIFRWDVRRVMGRGRVRAVTGNKDYIVLWLEVIDDACKAAFRDWDGVQVGEVLAVQLGRSARSAPGRTRCRSSARRSSSASSGG